MTRLDKIMSIFNLIEANIEIDAEGYKCYMKDHCYRVYLADLKKSSKKTKPITQELWLAGRWQRKENAAVAVELDNILNNCTDKARQHST